MTKNNIILAILFFCLSSCLTSREVRAKKLLSKIDSMVTKANLRSVALYYSNDTVGYEKEWNRLMKPILRKVERLKRLENKTQPHDPQTEK